jgi:hypothetical protein
MIRIKSVDAMCILIHFYYLTFDECLIFDK